MLNIGVIGLGFMGATHIAAWKAAAEAGYPVTLAAVADPKASRRAGKLWDVGGNAVSDVSAQKLAFDPSQVKAYQSAEELLADKNVDVVSICTRTDAHVDMAIAALNAGKHVLVEKPIALRSMDAERLLKVAEKSKQICMPAMCMRFWPTWVYLKEKIDDRSLGALKAVTFQRLASMPMWSSFFENGSISGGAHVDVHIHDTDFVRFCFGVPTSVSSAGYVGRSGAIDHVTTAYHFSPSPGTPGEGRGEGLIPIAPPAHIVAEGGWDHAPGFAFRMRYVAVFEKGTLDFDLTRSPQLLLCNEGTASEVEVSPLSGYDGQVRHLVDAITKNKPLQATIKDAVEVARILEAEAMSVEKSTRIFL